jgi:hypothetical protein
MEGPAAPTGPLFVLRERRLAGFVLASSYSIIAIVT